MNTKDFITKLSEESGLTKKDAATFLAAFKDVVGEVTVDGGEDIQLTGFGKFFRKDLAARQGRNPATGETIQIAARTKPGFKFSPTF